MFITIYRLNIQTHTQKKLHRSTLEWVQNNKSYRKKISNRASLETDDQTLLQAVLLGANKRWIGISRQN